MFFHSDNTSFKQKCSGVSPHVLHFQQSWPHTSVCCLVFKTSTRFTFLCNTSSSFFPLLLQKMEWHPDFVAESGFTTLTTSSVLFYSKRFWASRPLRSHGWFQSADTHTLTGHFRWAHGAQVVIATIWCGSPIVQQFWSKTLLIGCAGSLPCERAYVQNRTALADGPAAPVTLPTKAPPKSRSHVCFWMLVAVIHTVMLVWTEEFVVQDRGWLLSLSFWNMT